jgi:hypothetical protein
MEASSTPKKEAGKGDSPRNCFSVEFQTNFGDIVWDRPKLSPNLKNNDHRKSTKSKKVGGGCGFKKHDTRRM